MRLIVVSFLILKSRAVSTVVLKIPCIFYRTRYSSYASRYDGRLGPSPRDELVDAIIISIEITLEDSRYADSVA